MKVLAIVGLLLTALLLVSAKKKNPVINDELINTVNAAEAGWTADHNAGSRVHGLNFEEARRMMGALKGGPELPHQFHDDGDLLAELPESFDSRTQWPHCPTISDIRDQSACGLCWAFGAVEAMSDRMCIHLGQQVSLSAAGLGFCCKSCGFGCNGGYPSAAWKYWVSDGIVEEGCYPYPFPPCGKDHPNPCPPGGYKTQPCPNQCNATWTGPQWKDNLHKGKSAYSLKGAEQIMMEIYKNGPVEAAFSVYEDFMTYKSGVYKHVTGRFLGGHAVKLLGWGVSEDDEPYWILANSWNTNWGDKGYFKMLRGRDECGIESNIVAGMPLN